ncbi:MAG TPA: 1-acyl-sn-glycerol-3-phosphate acyltransferase [Bacteroidales bacterium]|nr:1-acyl-sn-glycerol-3-phosphate acyltransferase [Bacteroidales bacterium]
MFAQGLCKGILRLIGWKWDSSIPDLDKCVICVAPHTSNWDFVMGKLAYTALGRNANFVIKQEWMRGPIGKLMSKLGGIGVDRNKPSMFTDQMAELYRTRSKFNLAITPEGTRKANPKWKKGFYHIAMKAQVPIALVKIDYGNKQMSIFELFTPTGNEQEDIFAIQQKYMGVKGKHPEKFVLPSKPLVK